jgi:tetratricopeptide (TPR) repeat protein
MKLKHILPYFFTLSLLLTACTKEFLDKKPDKALLVPETLIDFRALLDFIDDMNTAPGLNVISADDFYRDTKTIVSLNPVGRNTYLWAKDLYAGTPSNDWNKPYNQVFVANVVLDGLSKADRAADPSQWDALKGSALFFRAYAIYNLAQEFAAPYKPSTASSTAGIPIRLTADVNKISGRGNLSETYAQVAKDLTEAAALLPASQPFKSRPVKAAAYALLSRVYLTMQQYASAAAAASDCIMLNGVLIDYNTLNTAASRPFPVSLPSANDEVLLYTTIISTSSYNSSASTLVDSILFKSYSANDLRKAAFFNDKGNLNVVFKGNYTGSSAMFGGLSVDEVYLNRAEAFARLNKLPEAINDLNKLLLKRWKKGTYVPYTVMGQPEAIALILTERRKELVGRGLRWADLRRLNQEDRFKKDIVRSADGRQYVLKANSLNYALPIPDNEINASHIEQNERE